MAAEQVNMSEVLHTVRHHESHRSARTQRFVSQVNGHTPGLYLEGTSPRASFCLLPLPSPQPVAPCISQKEVGFIVCSVDNSVIVRL